MQENQQSDLLMFLIVMGITFISIVLLGLFASSDSEYSADENKEKITINTNISHREILITEKELDSMQIGERIWIPNRLTVLKLPEGSIWIYKGGRTSVFVPNVIKVKEKINK